MVSEESSLLVQEYYKSDQYNTISEDFTVSVSQGNSLCGDTITVYLTIEDEIITKYSYSGDPAQITKAAAEFLWEFIIWENIQTVLNLNAQRVRSEGFEVSNRRIRSSISALLAARNAIHVYLQDDVRDEYEDLID